jgi:predicted RNA-binding protein
MCEAAVYVLRPDGGQDLVMEDVDLVDLDEEGVVRLVSIFGVQHSLKARIKSMSLASHRIILEKA